MNFLLKNWVNEPEPIIIIIRLAYNEKHLASTQSKQLFELNPNQCNNLIQIAVDDSLILCPTYTALFFRISNKTDCVKNMKLINAAITTILDNSYSIFLINSKKLLFFS